MSTWADIKEQARSAVHATFARAATYQHTGMAAPVALSVRWHAAGARVGDLENQGFAQVVTTADRIVFDAAELATLGIVPARGATVVVTGVGSFLLDTQDEPDGPVAEPWTVTRA